MLVLTRRLNESILLTGGIKIKVVKIDRGRIQIGIEAPSDVSIYREEIAPENFFHAVEPCKEPK